VQHELTCAPASPVWREGSGHRAARLPPRQRQRIQAGLVPLTPPCPALS